jgi:hypothetical protein
MRDHCGEFPRNADGARVIKNVHNPEATLRHPWGDTDFVQGARGIVLDMRDGTKHLTPTFVEVCTDSLNADRTGGGTFLRGEGATIEEAEDKAWAIYQRQVGCPSPTGSHENETRGYVNGAGFCKHCGRFESNAFSLQEIGSVCCLCGDDYSLEVRDRMVCKRHAPPSYQDLTSRSLGQPLPQWIRRFVPTGSLANLDFKVGYEAVKDAQDFYLDGLLQTTGSDEAMAYRDEMWGDIEDYYERLARHQAERTAETDAQVAEEIGNLLTSLVAPKTATEDAAS